MEVSGTTTEALSSTSTNTTRRWNHLRKVMTRRGPFVQDGFDTANGPDAIANLAILVIGAGGLGCEMLKALALMGFTNLTVIDCDTIDLSNLNRQFLFRTKDIGRSKAEVAAEFIQTRVNGTRVRAHNCKIEDMNVEFYRQFDIIMCGLDAIEPRRWLNSLVYQLLIPISDGGGTSSGIEYDGTIPIIDGGTEGFKGNCRIITPGSPQSPCIECQLDLFPPRVTFPLCTLSHRPRLPEHCIEYVRIVQWDVEHPFGPQTPLDGDDPAHLQWIHERALERAKEYKIEGVTYRLTQGVVKHIIPAVASTNAVIASACVTEAFKLATASAPPLNNYLVFNNSTGIYTYTYQSERKPQCIICSTLPETLTLSRGTKLSELLAQLSAEYDLKQPTLITIINNNGDDNDGDGNVDGGQHKTLYMYALDEQLKNNLAKTLPQLEVNNGQTVLAIDRTQRKTFIIQYS